MPEETVPPNSSPPPSSLEEQPPAKLKGRGAWAWLFLAVLALFVGVQVAGVGLRDRLEGRRPLLPRAPQEGEKPGEPAAAPQEAASRFGPEVREVVVARPPLTEAQLPPAPEIDQKPPSPAEGLVPQTPGKSQEQPTPTEGQVPRVPGKGQERPPPAPAHAAASPVPQAQATPASSTPPGASATSPKDGASAADPAKKEKAVRALEVDSFLSQRYLRETEETLESLGLPHLRVESLHEGKGFRLFLLTPDDKVRKKARSFFESGHYAFREAKDGVEVYFYYEDEARTVVEALAQQELSAKYSATQGARPVWKLFAGPFPEPEARSAQARLASKGIKTLLRKWP